MTSRIHPWRRLVHILLTLLFFGLPFLRIGGESAFRFDIPTLRLHFFGAVIWMNEFFIVLVAILFLTFLFIWVTLVFGRVWCGWLCPQLILTGMTASRNRLRHLTGRGLSSHLKALLLSVLTGAAMVWYFVSPYDFLSRLAAGDLGRVAAWSWVVLAGITWLDLLLVRESFCATICPYSRLQGAMFDRDTLVIAFDPERAGECVECQACIRTCPVGIDIREGLQAACVSCAECVDACAHILGKKGRPSLIGYFYGRPGGPFRPFRPAAVFLAAALFFFFGLLLLLIAGRSPVDLTILPNHGYPPRMSPDGRIVNSFLLSLENRAAESASLGVRAVGAAGAIEISPPVIEIEGGAHRRIPVFLVSEKGGPIDIILTMEDGTTVRAHAAVIVPDS
jgi:cytochrome c oxidase accessory protein FixG